MIDDEIDVLVDLDGLTNYKTSTILALDLPFPTVSWLGFSPAPGLTDYIIADDDLIPRQLEQHYKPSKVLRLPGCYLSCGGFSMVPSQYDRESLNIPSDSFVFMTNQKPVKQLQMRGRYREILDRCPEAFLVVKDFAGHGYRGWVLDGLKAFGDRVRFLPCEVTEEASRGALRIADVMLDSYPYNGTTTTLEALYFGIPVVSQCGEQFSSRQAISLNCDFSFSKSGYIQNAVEYYDAFTVNAGTGAERTNPVWDYRSHAQYWMEAIEQIWMEAIEQIREF
jgi:predicted O-linked N-acetylglucosamine transferase (SPINDLY family)